MALFQEFSYAAHFGRRLPKRETSYATLTFLVLALGVLLASFTLTVAADSTQGSGQYSVTAVVPGARPTQAVVITSPTTGQTFTVNPVVVEGTCQKATLVKVFTNGIMVGSIFCGDNGRFSIPVQLVIGRNDLTAQSFNALDQEGPTSNTVTVTLNQPPGAPGFSTELLIQSENYYRGSQPGQEIVWPITLIGGLAPYAVSIDWGDGTQDVVTRLAAGPFTVKHVYKHVGGYLGSYPLIIRASDAVGHTAYLQLTTIVNSPDGATTDGSGAQATSTTVTKLLVIWPIWIVLLLMVISFWLGERREKHIMQRQMEALA
jgi:uncharacterized membrane protein YciS (DUF1049 family)